MKKQLTLFSLLFLLIATAAWADKESMPSMPFLEPTKTYLLKGDEDLDEVRGFADKAPIVRMQNLMMVEGSGYEGMDMDMTVAMNDQPTDQKGAHDRGDAAKPEKSVSSVQEKSSSYDVVVKSDASKFNVGANLIELSIQKDQKPAKGLKLKAEVFMTSMDMGKDEAKVQEKSPGEYVLKATFAMKGPWAVKLIFLGHEEKTLNFDIQNK
jgi:hypothetical protein